MKPNPLPTFSDDLPGLELTEHCTKFTVTSKQYVSNFMQPTETGYEFGNWEVEPMICFRVLCNGKEIILTRPEEFEQFGIFDFEQGTIECEPENDCNV
jgi:hypothetical protein